MLRVYNVTDLPAYGPARAVMVNRVPVGPGKSQTFESINLPRGRQVSGLTPASSGLLVLGEGEVIPLRIRQAYVELRAPVPTFVPVEEIPKAPLTPQPAIEPPADPFYELAKLTFSQLKPAYLESVGKKYPGRKSRQAILDALRVSADRDKLVSWLESRDA